MTHRMRPDPPPPSPVPPTTTMPAWVWVAAMLSVVLAIGLAGHMLGIGDEETPAASPSPSALSTVSTPGAALPELSTSAVAGRPIPDLIGNTGVIAAKELQAAGFTDISYKSVTHNVIPLRDLANWTVKSIEPQPGMVTMPSSTIVVTLIPSNR